MSRSRPSELLVVGAGVIGLSIAWLARRQGIAVTVLEREAAGQGTSRVAAGMVAPVAEVEFGPAGRRLLDLGLRSAAIWPRFAERLAERSGIPVELRRTGTLLLAADADDAAELERQLEFRRSLGLDVRRLAPSAARELEPALAPVLRGALEVPDDHAVDPRRVLQALRAACEVEGVELRECSPVRSLEHAGGRVTGVELLGGERLAAENVVLAAGPWSGSIEGLETGQRMPVRPVKGQILRLRDPGGPGLLERVIRYTGGYVVPRGDGRYVLGATVEERGFELGATAGGVYELLRDAHELLPGLAELEIEELSTGLRPGTPDNLPAIGRGALDGLWWATGHHRNGILLAPLTAELLLTALAGGLPAEESAPGALERDAGLLTACDPARFAAAPEPARIEVAL
jgi:glycine oxidase